MGLLAVGALMLFGVITIAVLALVSTVAAGVLWLVMLPFRLVFFLLKLIVVGVVGTIGAGILLVFAVAGALVLGIAALAPLLPVALLVGIIWIVAKSIRRPVNAVR